MIQEDFIVQKWFNSTHSELENRELVQNPTEEGFLWQTATLKKRPGLFTDQDVSWDYTRSTDSQIMGKVVRDGNMFFWDDECNVYNFTRSSDSYELEKVYNASTDVVLKDKDMYWNDIKQKAIVVPYLCDYVNGWTADKVSSTNDDGNGNVKLVVNESAVFSSDSVWDYIYFNQDASSNARWQIRQIVEFIDDQTVFLNEQFYSETSTWEVNESWETYNTIDDVAVFNNIRNKDNLVLCIWVNNYESSFRNLWGNDIEIFEWRFRYINWYGSSVGWSVGSGEYEILDPSTILGASIDARWQKMNSLLLTKNYLLVNMDTSIHVVWQIAATDTSDPIYNLNSIINGDSAFYPESIFSKGWLYYISKDRTLESGDIIAVSSNIIYGETKNQWVVVQKYLDEINPDTYVRVYDYWRWMIIQYVNNSSTTMLMYDNIYEWWMVWKYNEAIRDKFDFYYWDMVIWVGNKVCLRKWNSDLWQDIRTKYVVTWSKNFVNSMFSLKKIKISLWYYSNVIKFKIRLDLWYAVFEGRVEKDAKWVEYLTRQNLAANWDTMWSIPIGFNTLGWDNSLNHFIAKIWLIGIPIGKKCTYYKLTLENLENFDLNIVGLSVMTEWWNPYVTPACNVF